MTTKRTDAVWVEIDPASLNEEQATLYRIYKDVYAQMKSARTDFEDCMGREVPQGQRMIFGYNFGKLSVAVVADDRKPKVEKGKQSLSEYLASMQAAGNRT